MRTTGLSMTDSLASTVNLESPGPDEKDFVGWDPYLSGMRRGVACRVDFELLFRAWR